jgi:hypothetical protein
MVGSDRRSSSSAPARPSAFPERRASRELEIRRQNFVDGEIGEPLQFVQPIQRAAHIIRGNDEEPRAEALRQDGRRDCAAEIIHGVDRRRTADPAPFLPQVRARVPRPARADVLFRLSHRPHQYAARYPCQSACRTWPHGVAEGNGPQATQSRRDRDRPALMLNPTIQTEKPVFIRIS